ncbi:MAG: biotin--[acetyl-CoA-carboxylase] ligase [Myxococcota bacterium]|nr:biotin--[acetyl-CoA-carboxylase] ligase [Myxococcota bacterium]
MDPFDDRPLGARVASLLSEGPANGQALAECFGVSRQAIWKAIQALKAEGVPVESTPQGYSLGRGGYGPLSLSWRCERPVVFFEQTDSTNRQAFQLGLDGAESGTLVVAETQSAGKGRLGRSWRSLPGKNLAFSLLLRPPLPPEMAPLLSLATAVGIGEVTGLPIKWPNDVLAPDGRKAAGILAELHAEVGRLHFVVLGVGINVHAQEFPDDIPGTSLAEQFPTRDWDRAELLGGVVARIESRCAQLSSNPDKVLDAWRAQSATLGKRVRVGQVEGIAVDLRQDGALIVETGTGRVPILAGDVQMVSAR